MKRRIPIWLMLSGALTLLLLIGGSIIYSTRNDIIFNEKPYIGDIEALNGVSIELVSNEINFKYNTLLQFQDGFHWKNHFKALYYTTEEYRMFSELSLDTYPIHEIYERERLNYNKPGIYRYKLKDYFTYLPIQLSLFSDGYSLSTKKEQSELLKITVPDFSEFVVEIVGNSTSIENSNIPAFFLKLPYVKINDINYFTISNYELEKEWQVGTEDINLQYQGTSGILKFDTKQDTIVDIPLKDAIKVLYPIDIGDKREVTVLSLSNVKEEYLALTVLEKDIIFLYLYDIRNERLVTKTNVGKLPENAEIQSVTFVEQGEYLLANYQYQLGNSEMDTDGICAVYQVTKDENVTVLLNKTYQRELMELENSSNRKVILDMLYKNEILYLLFRNSQIFTSIDLAALSNEGIIYSGTIENTMYEDFTIGPRNYTMNQLTDYGQRYLQEIKFIR